MNSSRDATTPDTGAAARRILGAAGVLLATGIVIGALGAHALRAVFDARQLASLDTAVEYQLINALGLLVIGALMKAGDERGLRPVAMLLVAGVLGFSGGIYLMLAGAPRLFGFVTPIGGVLLIAAWAWFAVLMVRRA
jgi:uncharacterized membrane protein YgdD (TMEM256/DUF423 family)